MTKRNNISISYRVTHTTCNDKCIKQDEHRALPTLVYWRI